MKIFAFIKNSQKRGDWELIQFQSQGQLGLLKKGGDWNSSSRPLSVAPREILGILLVRKHKM